MIRGLHNFGNTCYYNSALQLLMQLPILNTNFDTTDSILNEMKLLYNNYISNLNIDSNLKKLYILCCNNNKYPLGSQQDSCEIVQLILDKIVDFIPNVKTDIRVLMNQLIRCNGDNCNNKYKICKDQQESMLISHALNEASNENNQTIRFDTFLQSALELSNCTNYKHECNCNNKERSIQTVLTDLPTYLFIKVGRCDNYLRKINRSLHLVNNFTLTTPKNLSELCETGHTENISHKYELNGIIVHYGSSLNSGHYVSYVKKDKKWFLCNDSQITEVNNFSLNSNEILTNSCVLLYIKL
jgi:ubiquitin C-terminal hydrolase